MTILNLVQLFWEGLGEISEVVEVNLLYNVYQDSYYFIYIKNNTLLQKICVKRSFRTYCFEFSNWMHIIKYATIVDTMFDNSGLLMVKKPAAEITGLKLLVWWAKDRNSSPKGESRKSSRNMWQIVVISFPVCWMLSQVLTKR